MKLAALLLLSLGWLPQQPSAQTEPKAAKPAVFDHRPLDALLKAYVHQDGLVDYRGLKRKGRASLQAYLMRMETISPARFRSWSEAEKQAFWINAYNAYTLELILRHYPVDSIKDLGSLFSSVFSKRFIPLQHLSSHHRKPLSLGELEHEILGTQFDSPMFHFAIVCASISCPPLRAEAYDPIRLNRQLADQARIFLADSSKNDVRIIDGKLRISKIFDWSEDELEKFPGGIRGLLKSYGPPSVAQDPALAKARFRYRSYDWSLNEWQANSSKP
ncbi:MAG: DUF547 domain-containing protein [Planctomycetota bacterium]|nr:MAG: DUF547 domain-containing protein [Planctomycetota bacterium]